jgi:flagellar basal-body rod protein FlgB
MTAPIMGVGVLDDRASQVYQLALDGLARRADVRANNIANVNTPGYVAGHVDFESALADRLDRPGRLPSDASGIVSNSPTYPTGKGNTVNLETEMVGLIKDQLTRQTLTAQFNFKARMLRTAVGR